MKKIFFCLIVFFLCFQLVSATDTTIQIKTVPFKNVNVLVLSEDYEVYERFNADSDEYGDVSFIFSSSESRFSLTIRVEDTIKNKRIAYEKLEDQFAGEDVYLEVVPEGFEIIETPEPEPEETNETLVLENETIEDNAINETGETNKSSPEKKFKISGKAIFGKDSTLRKILYYAGGIIVLAIIIFFVRKFIKSKSTKEIKIKKLSELKEEKKETEEKKEEKQEREEKIDDYKEAIEDAQKKIKEAQEEITKLKNRDRIKEIEKRIEQEQRELKKLKGE